MVNNFRFSAVRHLISEVEVLIRVSSHNMETVERFGGHDSPAHQNSEKAQDAMNDCAATAIQLSDYAKSALGWLDCSHINEAAKRLKYWGEEKSIHKWPELNTRSRALRDAIDTELKEYFFYQYPKEKGRKFRSWKDDWKASLAAFPSIQWDVYEATDCYALQHYTASVFHSMRIAEIGLRALAKERSLSLPKNKPVEWGTWQEIIKALDEEIKAIGLSKKAGPAKDSALEFYSGSRADLNGFKDEYRNLVMHVRERYDEHQALRALHNVHAFMERVAAKIDASHKPIDWGF